VWARRGDDERSTLLEGAEKAAGPSSSPGEGGKLAALEDKVEAMLQEIKELKALLRVTAGATPALSTA